MNPLVTEFNEKIIELEKLAEELSKDFLAVKSSEESLLVESVVKSLEEDRRRIERVVFLEQQRAGQK